MAILKFPEYYRLPKKQVIDLILNKEEEEENSEALSLLEELKKLRRYDEVKISYVTQEEEQITPTLITPGGSFFRGVKNIRGYVELERNSIEAEEAVMSE